MKIYIRSQKEDENKYKLAMIEMRGVEILVILNGIKSEDPKSQSGRWIKEMVGVTFTRLLMRITQENLKGRSYRYCPKL